MNKNWMKWGISATGILFVIAGAILLLQADHTRSELQDSLARENITGSDPEILMTYEGARAPEGVEIPEVVIDTAMEAYYQAQVIRTHTLNITEGKTYADLDREDPDRALYITSLTLQNSLYMAHMGLEITRLIAGLGVAFFGLGAGMLVFGLPLINKVYGK